MSMRLIVNSDDYGRTAAVSQGVRNAHLFGIVTSTTCMMNMPTVVEDIRTAMQEAPRLGMGVHLVLTSGQPLLPAAQVPSLVTSDGAFLKLDQFLAGLDQIDPAQVKAEWRTQIERFVATAGRSHPPGLCITIRLTLPSRSSAPCLNSPANMAPASAW